MILDSEPTLNLVDNYHSNSAGHSNISGMVQLKIFSSKPEEVVEIVEGNGNQQGRILTDAQRRR